jgi:XTP/dITP diphosphohydrolase
MKLIFATNNQHKADEIRSAVPPGFTIQTLKEAGIDMDIPEPHDTLQDNAAEKARTIFRITHTDCFSEDTGLEVRAINNEPGVHSARYAGDERDPGRNIEKLLGKLKGIEDRSARFRTVICLVMDGKSYFFEGSCEGKITMEPIGNGGFGYDSVFIPDGASRSFAEMDVQEKNLYSHRRKATDLLVTFLNHLHVNK